MCLVSSCGSISEVDWNVIMKDSKEWADDHAKSQVCQKIDKEASSNHAACIEALSQVQKLGNELLTHLDKLVDLRKEKDAKDHNIHHYQKKHKAKKIKPLLKGRRKLIHAIYQEHEKITKLTAKFGSILDKHEVPHICVTHSYDAYKIFEPAALRAIQVCRRGPLPNH